jgi:hypothetical protein
MGRFEAVTHYPKRSRCQACSKRLHNCSNLPFHTMPVHRQDGADTVVICTEFATASGEVGKPFFHDHHRRRKR